MNYKDIYKLWTNSSAVDADTKKELESIADNETEIEERFYKNLEFGTGGLRGVLGAGTNRMNIYTVRKATQGLCNFIIKENQQDKGVVISYDPRHNSSLFADESARVLAANGIKAYVFDELRPTPMLSFAVRELGCFMGIMITASHNPKIYNGYKVYSEDGGQLPPYASDAVIEYIDKIDIFEDVKVMDLQEAKDKGLYQSIGAEIDERFLEEVYKQSVDPSLLKNTDLKLIYTPIHGTGNKPVRAILEKAGLKNVMIVREQELPDPDFSTVKSPNPEEKSAFTIAIEMAKANGADLIVGTDPDCDRVGVVVKNNQGEYVVLTGNQTGVLLADYILKGKKKAGSLAEDAYLVKTIVTTELINHICNEYNTEVKNVLTGFKFIGDKIKESEDTGVGTYVFGFEESYGYLAGTYARDKDAVVATMLIAEMAAYYKTLGKNLYDALIDIFEKYGYYYEETISVTMPGKDGMEKMSALMDSLRGNCPESFDSFKVLAMRDYKSGIRYDLVDKSNSALDLPSSNVLYFELENDDFFVIRPSGTEPKIKLYFLINDKSENSAKAKLEAVKNAVKSALF